MKEINMKEALIVLDEYLVADFGLFVWQINAAL